MRFPLPSVVIGIAGLRANPLRTMLSTLGVIIGVASLVAILALGDGLEQFSRSQIEQTTDLQFITVDSKTVDRVDGMLVRRPDVVMLGLADADDAGRAVAGRADVALSLSGSAYARVAGDTARHATLVTATTPSAAAIFGLTPVAGRFLMVNDTATQAIAPAVVTASFARAAHAEPATLVGKALDVGGVPHLVIGVLGSDAAAPARIYVPMSAAQVARLGEQGRTAPTLLLKARRVEDIDSVRQAVEGWLTATHGSATKQFTVSSSVGRARQAKQAILVFKLIMGSITGISILVGGIGIMNILLASVAERTREIGIRKAVGAHRADVMVQFLAESVAISGVGSLIGVVLGLTGAFGITAIIRRATDAPIRAGFAWSTVFVAAVAAILVGVIFGTYPARRAARLSPIDAIRHE